MNLHHVCPKAISIYYFILILPLADFFQIRNTATYYTKPWYEIEYCHIPKMVRIEKLRKIQVIKKLRIRMKSYIILMTTLIKKK